MLCHSQDFSELIFNSSWFDRIPFVLLFGIATSIELFQEKLPRAAIRHLHGMKFEAAQTGETLEKMFKAAASNGEYRPMWLGAGISNLLLQRQRNHAQNVEDFVRAFKVPFVSLESSRC